MEVGVEKREEEKEREERARREASDGSMAIEEKAKK